ncbi:MAG: LD-carboxypeptidase [Gemmatimonadota bacterium]
MAPAGPVNETMIRAAVARCRHLGFEPVPGAAIRERHGYLAGSDARRAADLRAAIDDDTTAIWALRGGYGTLRTLARVDLSPLVTRPKAFLGFSDNTAVHLALRKLGLVSFHAPHAGYEHFPPVTERAFRGVVMARRAPFLLPWPEDHPEPTPLCPGSAEGPLVGGNLAMLAAACGTPYQPELRGAILFLEDVGEPLYRLDRMLTQLRLAGVLAGVAGIALGAFTPPAEPDPSERVEDPPTLRQVLRELLAPLGVPVLMGLPFGHERENWTLPVGTRARLDADAGSLEIMEPATAERGTR